MASERSGDADIKMMGRFTAEEIPPWLHVSWLEWRRSFQDVKGTGPGHRDFLWLTLLLWSALTLSLFAWSSEQGLRVHLVRLMVGHVQGYGVPVWIVSKTGTGPGMGFGEGLVNQIEKVERGVKVFPYYSMGNEILLPSSPDGTPTWSAPDGRFNGRAITRGDPLVNEPVAGTADRPVPPSIILNKRLFENYFECPAYRRALAGRFPALTLPSRGTDNLDKLECLRSKTIWMDVDLSMERDMVPFHIIWNTEIPSIGDTAFLLPIDVFFAIRIARQNPGFVYFPEGEGAVSRRVRELLLREDAATFENGKRLAGFRQCVGGLDVSAEGVVTLRKPLPERAVRDCAMAWKLTVGTGPASAANLSISAYSQSGAFGLDEQERLTVPCGALSTDWRRRLRCPGEAGLSEGVDPQGCLGGSLSEAIAYLPESSDILDLVKRIESLRPPVEPFRKMGLPVPPAVYVYELYRDALTRHGLIERIGAILSSWFKVLFLPFLLFLLSVFVGSAIAHRRREYGVLLARGMLFVDVRRILSVQVCLSFAFGWLCSVGLLSGVHFLLRRVMARILVSPDFSGRISSQLDILPFGAWSCFAVPACILFLALIVTYVAFSYFCAKGKDEPCHLLYA